MLSRFHKIPERHGRTDRRTDGQTDLLYRILTRDKNGTALSIKCWTLTKQELSYSRQIARQLRTQYVDGIYRHNYPVTLKSKLRITRGHWKREPLNILHDLLVVELFDVEYYRDLEMWVRCHSSSLKMVPFESLGSVSFLFAFHSNYGRIFSHFGDIQRQRTA